MTCSTQPTTLLVEKRGCALFLHPDTGLLWLVTSIAHGQWDWESADAVDVRPDNLEILLRDVESLIRVCVDQRSG